jgi:hypothetical protein
MDAGMLELTLLTSWGSLRERAPQAAKPFDSTRGYARAYPMGIAPSDSGVQSIRYVLLGDLTYPYVRLFITKHLCWAH